MAQNWQRDATSILLGFIWRGYDLLCKEVLDKIDINQADEDLERSVTQLLEPRVHRVMTGDEPFFVQHGPYEEETRHSAQAQPPVYDLAFVLRANERIKWPCEAKVLHTDGSVAEYRKAVTNEFLMCRYAPFSSQGAMLAYLFAGEPEILFTNIAAALACRLDSHPSFPQRPHRRSDHMRVVPTGKNYPRAFRCHHMVLRIGAVPG